MPKPVSIVTGASRGIGRAIAVELSRTHHVIATYKSNVEAARGLTGETGAEIVRCDVSSAADRAELIRYARERCGALDLLVNNAGIAPRERRDVLEAAESSFDELMATNLKGPAFPHGAGGRLDAGARFRPHRVHHLDFVVCGVGESRRILHFEGRAQHVGGNLCAAPGAARYPGFRDPAGNYPHRYDRCRGGGCMPRVSRPDCCRSRA